MANNTPNTLIKIIWMVHFALTSWAIMGGYLGGTQSYIFTHMGVLAFGFWAIVSTENIDALIMFLITLCLSLLNDIMLISIYQPRANDTFESDLRAVPQGYKNEYRWALGMSIVNVILTPVSIILVFLVYRSASTGQEFAFRLPGISTMARGGARTGQGQYTTIESAQDSHPGVYGRQDYPYQTAPQQAPPMEPKIPPNSPTPPQV